MFLEGAEAFGVTQAEAYFAKVENTIELIGENPGIARERFEIDPPVRIHPIGKHIIVYQEEEGGGVLIIRIRHSREDWQSAPNFGA